MERLLNNHTKIHANATDLFSGRKFENVKEESELCQSMPVHTDEMPSERKMICIGASSGICVLNGKVEVLDTNKLLYSSTSCSENEEESSTKTNDADSFKIYGCGICCQSFSTKEETMHCFHSH